MFAKQLQTTTLSKMKNTEYLREKSMVKSLNTIIKELNKLEHTECYKGVYIDSHAFNVMRSNLIESMEAIKNDIKS